MKRWQVRQFVPIVSMVAIVGLSLLPGRAIARETPERDRILTVTGRGSQLVPTEKTRVQLGVQVEGKTAGEVQAEIAKRSNAIVARLQELQVERLQTTSITLNPKYIYQNNRQIQDGFVGQSTVSFVTTNAKAGMILDAAVVAGANRVEQVSFIAPEEAVRNARNQALQAATKDALSQAEAVLKTLNLTQSSIRSIQILDASGAAPLLQNRLSSVSAADQTTPIVGGEQRVEASVVLEIGY